MSREALYRVRRALAPMPANLLAVDDLLARPGIRVLQAGSRTIVAIVELAGTEIVVKRFQEDTVLRALETLFIGSGALRVWRGAGLLKNAGLPAPEVLAALEQRRFGVPCRSCVLARRVAGNTLEALWCERTGAGRRALALAFADYLRRMHDAGLYPQDIRGANVLVPAEDPPVFVLVDLDRLRHCRRVSRRRRWKNLVQVHRSVGRGTPRSERLRFLRRYLGTVSRDELRRTAREILAQSRRKDAEYEKRRDQLARGQGART